MNLLYCFYYMFALIFVFSLGSLAFYLAKPDSENPEYLLFFPLLGAILTAPHTLKCLFMLFRWVKEHRSEAMQESNTTDK